MSWFSCLASLCISDVIITGSSGSWAQVIVLAALTARRAQAMAALEQSAEEQVMRLAFFLKRRGVSTCVVVGPVAVWVVNTVECMPP
jgi:hypothetical protein